MGANIGTTITSWILSLTGIQSDNFIIQMFKPTSFSPVLAIIGVIFILFINDSKKKDIGTIFIGFAILMYGMDMMSSAVKPLAEVPEFTNLLLKFSNPLLGVIAGALLTAVIQSSSASVGILQALCLTGAVPFSAAIPIIMGQNIGTCITAILSAIGAKKNAKRAAAVHLYFNLIGTVIFMTVFYLINAVVGFSFFHQAATPAGIAVIHSVFNVTATIILLPFAKGLEKLACLTIRDKKEDVVVSAEDRESIENYISMLEQYLKSDGTFDIDQYFKDMEVAAEMEGLEEFYAEYFFFAAGCVLTARRLKNAYLNDLIAAGGIGLRAGVGRTAGAERKQHDHSQ